jgi:hypothetical protein
MISSICHPHQEGRKSIHSGLIFTVSLYCVGVAGFEPTAPRSQSLGKPCVLV